MKMRMFGLGATLALAMLASTSLTSCYDSEHLDVTAPTVLAAPTYVVSGYVWDFVTGSVISGANVAVASGTATTDATGFFTIKLASPANGTISFSKEGYITETRNIKMETGNTGVVSYNASCFLIKETDIPGIQILDVDEQFVEEEWTAREQILLDLLNESSDPKTFTVTFAHLQSGAAFVEQEEGTKVETTLPEAVKARLVNYVKNKFGFDPSLGFSYESQDVDFTLPGNSSLYSVELVQSGVTIVLGFTLDNTDYVAVINACTGREFTPTIYDNSHYKGHGHGHNSHGNVINAGGGIFED